MSRTHHPWMLALQVALGGLGIDDLAHAQNVPAAATSVGSTPTTAPAARELEAIEVTGILLQRERAAQDKYRSDSIMDEVSADDIGKLPVKNAAEAVGRLPGVSFSVDQGEGRYVSIRGISPQLNNVTINGVDSGSPEADSGGRLVPLDVMGASTLKAIQVIKANTPDKDAQGIGGTVNLETKGPFDFEKNLNAIGSVRGGYDSANSKHPYSLDATMAWKNAAQTWGWVLNGAHQYRRLQSTGVYQDDWRLVEFDGAASRIPTAAKYNRYDIGRTRDGFNGQLEWRPATGQRLYLRGLYSNFSEVENRQRSRYYFNQNIESLGATSGTSSGNNRRQELRQEDKTKMLSNVAIGGEHQLTDWHVDWVAQYNHNRQREPNRAWSFRQNKYGDTAWAMNDKGLANLFGEQLGPTGMKFYDYSRQFNRNTESASIGVLNMQRQFDDEGSYFKFGVKYRRTWRDRDFSDQQYDAGDDAWGLDEPGLYGGILHDDAVGVNNPNMLIHVGSLKDFTQTHLGDPRYFDYNADDSFTSEYGSDYALVEKVRAGYLMVNLIRGPVSVIAGERYEHTQIDSSGYMLTNNQALPVQASGSYHNWLPDVVARWDITSQLVLRGAWTHTLGRPDYDQIAPISTLDRSGGIGDLTTGNAALKPRQSTNYDLSLEWYFGPGDLLSASLFYKNIKNEIVTRSQSYTNYDYQGEHYDRFTRTTYENANKATLRGGELNYQHRFAFLPPPYDGLGVGLSYARLSSSTRVAGRDDKLTIEQQPNWTGAATLFYQRGPWQIGVTEVMRGSYLSEIAANRAQDLSAGAYRRIDMQASYQLNEHVSLFLQGQNLNDRPTTEFQGHIPYQNTQYEEYGRTYYIGASVKL